MRLPEIRDFGWELKSLDSAQTAVTPLATGQIELTIAHETIRGVTAQMVAWWFSAFTGLTVEKDGQRYPAYHVWHPYDHIEAEAIKSDASAPMQKGDRIHIHEVFQREPRFEVDETAVVSTLDAGGMGLTLTKFGRSLMDLQHRFRDVKGGVEYRSRMVLGFEAGPLKPVINHLVLPRRFSEAKAKAWLTHNVEEVGCFEHFLAALYDQRDAEGPVRLD